VPEIKNIKSKIGNKIMAADFRINLAKDLTSSEEERQKFYHGMLIYLAACAVALVLVAYLASINVKTYIDNSREHVHLLSTAAVVAGIDVTDFRNPDQIYNELDQYSQQVASLKTILRGRVQLMPIVHNLFLELPEGVELQSLAANKNKLAFGMTMPPPSGTGDPVRDLRESWEKNEELMKRVNTIRPVTGERRTIGTKSVFYVQFECVVKK
jgi:hypothetical protein